MIVLDTNVISEIMLSNPDAGVVGWLNAQSDIWTTAITVFEIRFGLCRLPQGRKRQTLARAFDRMLRLTLLDNVLDFGRSAADHSASIMSERQAIGRPLDIRDAMIAGVVVAQGNATLATRNIKHFVDLDVPLVNPWTPS